MSSSAPRINWPLLVRRLHKYLALIVGVQILIWSFTGFYMVAIQLHYIHGNHLVKEAPQASVITRDLASPVPIAAALPEVREVRLIQRADRLLWRAELPDDVAIFDAQSGVRLAKPDEAEIKALAERIFTGSAPIQSIAFLDQAPQEVGKRKPPFWRVEFARWDRPTLYLSAYTGELMTKRHLAWRVFDFAWMLHIMDYEARVDSNNLLLRTISLMSLAMAVLGGWLLTWSFPQRRKNRRKLALANS